MTYAQSLFVVTVNGFAVVFVFDQFDLLSLPHFALERDQTWGKIPELMIVQKKSRFCQQIVGLLASLPNP